MDIIRKDATITNTDDSGPGAFEVILSAPTKDRDGDTLLPDEWKMPLPDHITFDVDHGMSVATTVGSGVPSIDDATGNLVVSGTYSSLPRAQDVRTLVGEGHIRTTSVAFMSERAPQKDGKGKITRELLNGAFVAVPSNREALVLSSKSVKTGGLLVKAGARNSSSDMGHIQSIHDAAGALGAECAAAKSVSAKSITGSLEAAQDRARDALADAYPGQYPWLRGTLTDYLVFEIFDEAEGSSETYRQNYTDDGSVVTLTGDATPVDVAEVVTPDPDETTPAAPAAVPAAAPAKAAAPAETKAAEAEDLTLRARSLSAFADGYTSGD